MSRKRSRIKEEEQGTKMNKSTRKAQMIKKFDYQEEESSKKKFGRNNKKNCIWKRGRYQR